MITRTKIHVFTSSFCILVCVSILGINWLKSYQREQEDTLQKAHISLLKKNLDSVVKDGLLWPKYLNFNNKKITIDYTFNESLTKYSRKLLRRHKSDYSAIIVIDNSDGAILSAVGYSKIGNKQADNLVFSSTHPSASLFKIITAISLLQKDEIDKSTKFSYVGKGSTLYKYQLLNKIRKWSRSISIRKAFALSNNVIFGKAAINELTGVGIFKQASELGFNKPLMKEFNLGKSVFFMPENQYDLAELASGFNKRTMISPVHGALLAEVVANDGNYYFPRVVRRIYDSVSGKVLWDNPARRSNVFDITIASDMKDMMSYVVNRGTARSGFRYLKRKIRRELFIGGKTGSITGGIPLGKRDWFTSYAIPKNPINGRGISICVMNINIDKWYVRSSFLASKIMEYYYSKIKPLSTIKVTQK